MAKTSANTDQATGLRQLFAAEAVRVVALVGSQSQSVATALAMSLVDQDRKVLLVDEALCATTSHPLLEQPLGWDVGDVLRGKKALDEVIVSVAGVALMPADTEHLGRNLEAARIQLLDTFHALVVGFDCVIIHAASDLQRHGLGFALAATEVIVLCDESDHGITEAYRHMKTLNRMDDDRHFMMMFRGGNEAKAKFLFHKLTAVCDRYLELKPDFACVLPTNRLKAARTLEMFAVDMMHWPLQNDSNRFDAFMCRLLSATGSNLTAV
ncbi:MAG: hypothetical protein K8Q92_05735 [Methylophilales bacterium]|nr:hypothetical protein [Methylophilales bacterium]